MINYDTLGFKEDQLSQLIKTLHKNNVIRFAHGQNKLLQPIPYDFRIDRCCSAEHIRALGTYVPGSFSRFSMLTQIDDETNILPQEQMVMELLEDNEKVIKILKLVFQQSEQNGEYGFSDFIAGRIDAHRKHGWMLKASSK